MFLGTPWSAAAYAALAPGGYIVPIKQAGDWARVPNQALHYVSAYITTTDWNQDSVQHTILGLSG